MTTQTWTYDPNALPWASTSTAKAGLPTADLPKPDHGLTKAYVDDIVTGGDGHSMALLNSELLRQVGFDLLWRGQKPTKCLLVRLLIVSRHDNIDGRPAFTLSINGNLAIFDQQGMPLINGEWPKTDIRLVDCQEADLVDLTFIDFDPA